MATVEVKTTTLHLFRALLRSASYLPDEFAQTYIHNHIIRRFRKAPKVTPDRLKDARSALNTLQRACNGELKPLTAVLQLAYGRTGRRRRELVVALLRPESAQQPLNEAMQEIEELKNSDDGEDGLPVPISMRPMLDTFLHSQAANDPPESSRIKIRTFEPQIPLENIWGRSVALKRQRGIRQRWWATTLNKLLPPLPEKEWLRLRDLATGAKPFPGPPARRPKATTVARGTSTAPAEDDSTGGPDLGLDVSRLKQPIRHAARYEKTMRRNSMNEHTITPRYMRRLWAGVWNQSPLMSYDAESKRWTVTWGGGRSAAANGKVGDAGRADLELFEGVDAFQQKIQGRRKGQRSKQEAGKTETAIS